MRSRGLLAFLAAASLAATPATAGPGSPAIAGQNETHDVRTFDVTVDTASGQATATVVDENERTRSFTLTRTVSGETSRYTRGTVQLDKQARTMMIQLEGGTVGMIAALSGETPAEATGPEATIPVAKDQYVYSWKWSDDTGEHAETWTEQTHVNTDITIHAPDGLIPAGGAAPPSVLLDASVASGGGYAQVEFCIDGKTVDTFEKLGRLQATATALSAGEHRFVVKVFGPRSPAHPTGEYLGEAEHVFIVAGLTLTPPTGTEVDPSVVVEATPVAAQGVASVRFYVDGKAMLVASKGPWAVKLDLPHTGAGHHHTISAIAYDAKGAPLARASTTLTVKEAPASEPHAPLVASATAPVDDPDLKGKPAITSFPADPKNYGGARTRAIRMIVMHKTEGPSVSSATNWFHNPAAHAAAHYVLDDQQIVQTVPDDKVAWHAGNMAVNEASIGIEVAGYHDQPVKNDQVYANAAKLVAWLCRQHKIAPSATTIIGHADVPDPDHPGQFGGVDHHTDPGGHPDNPEYWDWDKFMGLVQQDYGADD